MTVTPTAHQNRYAGQATAPDATLAPVPAATGDIDANGRLVGVDGILNQIGDALRRQVEPMLRDTILPIVQRDTALQVTIGHAAGGAIADELRPWIILGAGALALLAVTAALREMRHRKRSRHV